ncbi:MAG: YlxR family protein [Thermoanaerobacteraceae bacterium]|nr:YlxR family protein [Thermoanaerobacteraceae bacterium]
MKKIPMRMCVNCQQMYPKKELIRIVKRASDGVIVIDKNGKISGKGAYICHNKECIRAVIKDNKLERHLGNKIPDEIYKELEELLIE